MSRIKDVKPNIIKRLTASVVFLVISVLAIIIDAKYMLSEMPAVAADDDVIVVDNVCTINNAAQLVAFSKAYQANPAAYQSVDLYMAITSGSTEKLDGFLSIGTEQYPYAGDIIAGSMDISLTLDRPLFAHVLDSVEIRDSAGVPKSVTLARSVIENTPLFAENVLHGADGSAAQWTINISKYIDDKDVEHANSFSGVIGTICENAVVDLAINNNSITSEGSIADVSSANDVGLACRTMEQGASLSVSVSGTNTGYSVISESGNAGGLVGTMKTGAALTVNTAFATSGLISAGEYAGGIVGSATDASVTFSDPDSKTVNAVIKGNTATGGVFGYYNNTLSDMTVSGYDVSCTLNGASSGGLIGRLYNGGNITVDGTNTVTVTRTDNSGTDNDLGGLVGSYASDNSGCSLVFDGASVTVGKASGIAADSYGGIIGMVRDDCYVKFSNVTVTASFCSDNINTAFGGLVGSSELAFVDVGDIMINTSGKFFGGGVIGNMDSGVLRFSGTTDLSATEAYYINNKYCGQIVGARGQSLIFAEAGWQLVRGTAVNVDDIGSWGEVLRFNADTFTSGSVLSVDETAHTVTVNASGATVDSLSAFAALALNIQLNSGSAGTLLFDSGSLSTTLLSSTITLTADIDLTGTGITGLTRDDGSSGAFTGTLNGGGNTVTLSIGEIYGYRKSGGSLVAATAAENGRGIIYRHQFNGLIAQTGNNAAFRNLSLTGNINVRISDPNKNTHIGGLVGNHISGKLGFYSVNASETINVSGSVNNRYTFIGGFLARSSENSNKPKIEIEVKGCRAEPVISVSESYRYLVSAVIGEIPTNYEFSVNIDDVVVGAVITDPVTDSSNRHGGLIASISNYSNSINTGSRTVSVTNVTFDGAEFTFGSGGLLGEAWNNAEVTIGGADGTAGVTVNSTVLNRGGSGNYGALLDAATGYWQIHNIDIKNITVNAPSAASFGMFINKGIYTDYSKTFALYLELENENAFVIENADLSALKSGIAFDELLVTASGAYGGNSAENGNAVVSVHSDGGILSMDGTVCNTYQNQSGRIVTNNNTRYYYNLDVFRQKASAELSAPEKLMLWSVYSYAYDTLKKYFTNPITDAGNVIPSGVYDMTGYSYYPVNTSVNVTVQSGSSFIFCNDKVESGELGTGNSDNMARSSINSSSQHYLMHCGLFRNVSNDLTVTNAGFSGNIGCIDGSGALICGTFAGSNEYTPSLNINGIVLNGIKVYNMSADYAPLLINRIGSYTKSVITNVTAAKNVYSAAAATSLIGNVGSADADVIKLTFSEIVLDGRSGAGVLTDLDSVYGTSSSIFSKATLLNSFIYESGRNCSAVYNFKYSEDWDNGTAKHSVTYGREISESTEYTDKQRQYIDSDYYTDPEHAAAVSAYSFTSFLPYVAVPYDEAGCHEIKVNHKNTANLTEGCGTYNDPYIIKSADQLVLVAGILDGETPANDGVVINYHADNYKLWCAEKTDHTAYEWKVSEGNFADEGGNTISFADMQTALSTAYYMLDRDIVLPNSFAGIGRSEAFKGVIYGAGHTVTSRNTNPFIYQSKGAVIKDLNLVVTAKFTTTAYPASSKYATDDTGTAPFYGGLIGIVNGGDNIIDKVSVTFANSDTISVLSGSCYGNTAIGGYIGVVRYGGVIFRNMDVIDCTGISDNANKDFSAVGTNNYKGSDKKIRLYLNHIIGRVIDGYAFTESDSYKPGEAAVTVKNGTKNYSIADIDVNAAQMTFAYRSSGKSGIYSADITAPNAQALYLMGCIAMSGAGSANLNGGYPTAYSYGNGQMVRHADYSSIGTDASEAADFSIASSDNYGNNADTVPYVIYKYTPVSITSADGNTTINYPARYITNNSFAFHIELSGGEYIMPDGFRGIGSMTTDSESLIMYIYGISGNNTTIRLNSSLYSYRQNGYDVYYKVNSWKNYKTGLGLFNTLVQNKSSVTPSGFADDTTGRYKITDLTLSGTVDFTVYNNEGGALHNDKDYSSCAGALAGASISSTLRLENVNMSDVNVKARYVVGGLIGSTASGKSEYINCSANGVSADGGMFAGGLVGYVNDCPVTFDGQNGSFGFNSVSAASSTGNFNDNMGAGGLIGSINSSSDTVIKNINISGGRVDDYGRMTFVGGVIGGFGAPNIVMSSVFADNISVNNGIESTGYNGGIIGTIRSNVSSAAMTDVHLTNSYVCGFMQSGGIVGLVTNGLTADGLSVENCTIVTGGSNYECIGGIFAKTETAKSIILKNSFISDSTLMVTKSGGTKPVGGIIGHNTTNMNVKGYNIASINVQMTDGSGAALAATTYAGNVAGYVESGSVSIAGISIHKDRSGVYVGNNFGTVKGTGYAICSDYDGVCLGASANNSKPTVNSGADVADMGASPYATVNPAVEVSAAGHDVITGDGISFTAIDNIIADIGTVYGYNDVPASDAAAFSKYRAKLSTFKDKAGAAVVSDEQNFPVIVINDTNYSHVTEMLNSYIHLLTNDSSISNYANADSSRCNVDISAYSLSEAGLEKQTGGMSLEISNGYFRMTDTDYDSSYDNRFTLIDIQYLAPNDTSKVAYHLYIPVYVEKMLKYEFRVGALSGTTYNTSFYSDGNPVLESYGTPVTLHFTYSYQRTAQEWQDAINNGENTLKGYGKSILLKGSNPLPDNTKLVLVDRNDCSAAYYSTIGEAFTASDEVLSFDKFKSASGDAFEPVPFCDLLSNFAEMSAAVSDDGNLVLCDASDSRATFRDSSGQYYRRKTDSDTGAELYSVTLTPREGMTEASGRLMVDEDYYISLFTEENASAPMRNIAVTCKSRLGDSGMTPSRMSNANTDESIAYMILGNLYNQQFTFETTGDEVINENNNRITAKMQTVVTLKPDNADDVRNYLKSKSIHLYQGFIIEATRTDEDGTQKGIKGGPQVTGTYTTGGSGYRVNFSCSESVICFTGETASGGMVDIKQQLINDGSVTVTCDDFQITYYDEMGIIEQFPERKTADSDYGVVLSASSNLAYVQDNIRHSKITAAPAAPDAKSYYRENIVAASLSYNIPSNSPNELTKLGINGREANELIRAVGYYNVLNIPSEDLEKAVGVKFTLYLYRKNADGTYEAVNIDEYLNNVRIDAADGILNSSSGTNVYEFTFDREALKYEAGSFEVETNYSVKTGPVFESENRTYSNYKVLLEAQLVDSGGNIIANSGCTDHIIYTNARIYTNMVSV